MRLIKIVHLKQQGYQENLLSSKQERIIVNKSHYDNNTTCGYHDFGILSFLFQISSICTSTKFYLMDTYGCMHVQAAIESLFNQSMCANLRIYTP